MSRGTAVAERVEAVALSMSCLPALLVATSLFRAFVARLRYGIDVELMESGSLLQAYRVSRGLPLYPEPGQGFMPNPYPPLHTLVLAAFDKVFGVGFGVGRGLSAVAMVVTMTLLAREVYFANRKAPFAWSWMLMAVGFVAVGFPLTGGAYDIVRVDSLGLAFAVAAAAVALGGEDDFSRARFVALCALMSAAIFTKQTNLFFVAWIVLFVAARDLKLGLALGLVVVAVDAVATGALQLATHGSYWYYTVQQLRHHPTKPSSSWIGLWKLIEFAPYLPALPPLALVLWRRKALTRRSLLWGGMAASSLPAALLPLAKVGGSINAFIPAVVLVGPAALCLAGDARIKENPLRARVARIALALGAGAYLVLRSFDPAPYMPGPERLEAVNRLHRFVQKLPGSVLFPMKPFTAISVGERMEQVNAVGWFDYQLAGGAASFRPFLVRTSPHWVILTGAEPSNMVSALDGGYFLRRLSPPDTRDAAVLPLGFPSPLYVMEEDSADPPRTRCLFDFESATYRDWSLVGEAFRRGPFRFRPAPRYDDVLFGVQGVIVGGEGNHLANTANAEGGELATGTAVSPQFLLDGVELRLRVGGGSASAVRVELRIDGAVLYTASGHGVNYMEDIVWRVGAERGKRAELAIVDQDATGHILVDRVRLRGSDGAEGWCN
jgi:hypothetical protein